MGAFSLWSAPALLAAALVVGAAIYIAVRWRRAPAAFRAMGKVAGICFVAGFLAGMWALHVTDSHLPSMPSEVPPSTPSVPSSVPALEVGKAIVEMDEKHAGDTMWLSSAATAEFCNKGLAESGSAVCRIAYLAQHVLGKDLDRGPQGDSISLSDIADFCNSGAINKTSALCQRAYAARHAAMR
jgi:hypothetical protein